MQVPNQRLIVVGGSVTGLYTAIAGAKAGFAVSLVEKYPQVASRQTVFNLAPVVGDSLKRLDDGGDELVDALQVIVRRTNDDVVNNQRRLENFGSRIVADHTRELSARSMVAGYKGADSRPWSRVQIAGIENHMREYLARRFPQVDVRYDTTVEAISQSADGVTAHLLDTATGARDTIDGAFLVSGTGGRNALGIQRTPFPETSHFVGGLFEPVTPDRVELRRIFRLGEQLAPETHALNPPGRGWATVGLPGTGRRELPDSLVWAQIAQDAKDVPVDQLRAVLRDRAGQLGLGDLALREGDGSVLRANVQLALLHDQPAVHGRVLLAGDELLAPYFPTSTGASHALGVNGPLVDDTLRALREPGADVRRILDSYDVRARQEAAEVMKVSRAEMLEDLGVPNPTWEMGLAQLDEAARGVGSSAP